MGIYLNNGATSWPKPKEVCEAISQFISSGGANLGRGSASSRDMKTASSVLECRETLVSFFNGHSHRLPTLVTFTANITESLNTVLNGLLEPGCRVVTTSMEHNAVIRPLCSLREKGVQVDVVECDSEGRLDLDDLKKELDKKKTDLVVMSHASNICGTVQDLKGVAEICRQRGINLVADTAQTAGHIALDATELGLAALCFTGHKGLLGPQGICGIIWRGDIAQRCRPMIRGGTGSFSDQEVQPSVMPDKFESGTLNLPGIAGLNAAVQWIQSETVQKIAAQERAVGGRMLDGLLALPGVHLYGRQGMEGRVSVFLLNFDGVDNAELAAELSEHGIETRPGLHCSPWGHRTLGTFPAGGLRLSPGYFTTAEEVDQALEIIGRCAAKLKR